MPLVYDDLHRLAQRRMAGEREDQTLQTTALVHEAYVRLVDARQATWKDRAHFFAICAQLMRHILVDAARSRRALKRGAGLRVVELDEAIAASAEPGVDLIALDDALNALTTIAVTSSRAGQLPQPHSQIGLAVPPASITIRPARDPDQFAGSFLTDSIRLPHTRHQLPACRRLQAFFDSTSCKMCLSRLRSATKVFSFPFSSRNCRNSRSSFNPNPAKRFFQL
jgi:hypothetical protein